MRQPYPLDEKEQQLLFGELGSDAVEMATFAVNHVEHHFFLCRRVREDGRDIIQPRRFLELFRAVEISRPTNDPLLYPSIDDKRFKVTAILCVVGN